MSKRNVYGNFESLNNAPTSRRVHISPYDRLAVAIIIQAYKDYNRALTPTPPTVKYKRVRADKRRVREECEEFFFSEWYDTLTTIQPSVLINRAMLNKRRKTERRYAKLLMQARKPDRRVELEGWQKKEIRNKRKRRNV